MKKCRNDLYKVVKSFFKSAITYNPEEGWVEIITYDKEMEEIQRYSYEDLIVLNKDELEYVGVFRTEVRLKNAKLNYNKTTKLKLEKNLSTYLCEAKKKSTGNNMLKKYGSQKIFTD